jgi:hypothetical protein
VPVAPASIRPGSRNPIAVGVLSPSASATVDESRATVQPELSWLHVFTFGVVLLSGLNAIWEVNYPSTASYTLLLALFGLSIVSGVIALVRQARRRVHGGAVALIWVLVITFVLGAGGIDYVFTMVNIFNRARTESSPGPPTMVNMLNPFQMRPMAGFDSVLWIYGALAILLGLLGLIFAFMPGRAKFNPPPLPEEARP